MANQPKKDPAANNVDQDFDNSMAHAQDIPSRNNEDQSPTSSANDTFEEPAANTDRHTINDPLSGDTYDLTRDRPTGFWNPIDTPDMPQGMNRDQSDTLDDRDYDTVIMSDTIVSGLDDEDEANMADQDYFTRNTDQRDSDEGM